MIGICTDSNSQLPAELAQRFDIEVVPITVTIDGHDYLEGVDIDADAFYAMFESGSPEVSTSQPSPGQFAVAYEALLDRGCTEILSVHVAAAVSGTLNSARLAARSLEVPVRLIDSGTASFGVSCCVWAAAEAAAAGATLDQAAAVAEALSPKIGNVFVVGGDELVKRSGRYEPGTFVGDDVPVLTMVDGTVRPVVRVRTMDDSVAAMAEYAVAWGAGLRVAVGVADRRTAPLGDRLHDAIASAPNVIEVVRYRVGPSVGAHTGPGTVGCFMFPS